MTSAHTNSPTRSSRRGLSRLEFLFLFVALGVVVSVILYLLLSPGNRTTPPSSTDAAGGQAATMLPAVDEARRSFPGGRPQAPMVDDALRADASEREALRLFDVSAPPLDAVARTTEVAPSDSLRALEQLRNTLEAGETDPERLLQLFRRLGSDTLAAAWKVLDGKPWSRALEETKLNLLRAWAEQDPLAALAFTEESVQGDRMNRLATRTILDSWVESDCQAALQWYVEAYETDPVARRMQVGLLMRTAYASDPEGALSAIWDLPTATTQQRALHAIFLGDEALAGQEALLQLFDEVTDFQHRETLVETLVPHWAREDPAAAMAWIEALDDPRLRGWAGYNLARSWGRVAPDEAMAWLQQQGDAVLREEGAVAVVRSWARDDPDAALAWLEEQPHTATREVAVATASRALAGRAPRRAMDLASTLTDEEERVSVMSHVARRWARQDRTAATVYVLASDLPDHVKRRYATAAGQGRTTNRPGRTAN